MQLQVLTISGSQDLPCGSHTRQYKLLELVVVPEGPANVPSSDECHDFFAGLLWVGQNHVLSLHAP